MFHLRTDYNNYKQLFKSVTHSLIHTCKQLPNTVCPWASILGDGARDPQNLGWDRGGGRRVVGVVKYYFILSCTENIFVSGEF